MAKSRKLERELHNLNYHFVWIPKYRKKLLINKIKEYLKILIHLKAVELNCKIISLEVMPEHIHLFISVPSDIAPQKIVTLIKGYTSIIMRKRYSSLKRLLCLWAKGYFVCSAGEVSSFVIEQYIA